MFSLTSESAHPSGSAHPSRRNRSASVAICSSAVMIQAARILPEHFLHRFAAVDDLDGAADGTHVLLGGVDLEALANGAEEVGDPHGAVGDPGAPGVGLADDLAPLHAAAGESHVKGPRVVVAPGVG